MAEFPGVIIFFALSGFLITCSWCHSKSIKHYARNRFLRIFPALFVCFIVLQLAMVILGHLDLASLADYQIWMYWIGQLSLGQFFTPDSLREFGVGAPNGSLWTIPIEIEFYLIIPLLFILLTQIKVKTKIITLAVISILVNIILALGPSEHHTNATDLLSNSHETLILKLIGVSVAPYLYCFLLGSIIYLYWDKINFLFINKILYWLAIYLSYIYIFSYGPSYQISSFGNLISNLLLGCLSISAAFSFGNVHKFLYGIDISYGIYIIHMIVVNIFIELGYGNTITHAIIAILLTVLFSLLLYKVVEKPALALKRK